MSPREAVWECESRELPGETLPSDAAAAALMPENVGDRGYSYPVAGRPKAS